MGSKSPEERYYELLKDFVADKGEKALSMVADLSRELIREGVPLEDIAELHHHALSGLAQEFPEMTVREASGFLVQPLMEMLMAYALAFREQLEYRKKTEEILRRSSDELERLVEKRTAALSKANQELEAEITQRKQVGEALRESRQALSIRDRISRIFLTVSDDEVYREVLEVVLEVMESKYGVLGYVDENGAMVVPTMTKGVWDECRVPEKTFVFPRDTWGDSTWPRCVREKRPIYSNELSTKAPEGHIPMARHISLPILYRGEAIGLFQVANKEADYDDTDIRLLETIADYVGPVLHARLQREREQRMREKAEEALRRANEELERRVEERTAELSMSNERLRQEIAERKTAEKALRESEKIARSVLNATTDAVILMDYEGIVLDLNVAYADRFRKRPEEMVGTSVWDLFPPEVTARRRLLVDLVFQSGEPIRTIDERPGMWNDYVIYPIFDTEGKVSRVAVFAQDITERKLTENALRASEVRYQSLFNDSRDGVYVTTRDGRLVEANQALLDLFGYTREEMMAMAIRDMYLNPADRARFKEDIEQTGSVRDYELKLRRKDGSETECLVTSSVKRADDGSIIGYQGIIRDVTERKRLEQQLLQAQKMESLGTLAGGIAHDFNNLLTVILGYAELLLVDREKGDPGFADIQTISSSARRGADLVRRILTFSRRIDTRRRPIDLNHELKHTEKLLTRTIPKMIKIELRLEENLKRINGDPAQVEQALLNLAVNAQHAMPEGGKLTVKTENVTLDEDYCRGVPELQPGQYVLLVVSDTGHGIEKEILDHVFEPFFTTKQTGEGTGLGLSMVYGIVKSHDGHIACYSRPGEGTVFNIYLPVGQTEELSDMETAPEAPRFGTETILLVDDDETVGQLGRRLLGRAGHKVLLAGNGQEALKVYRKKQPDISLVILDLIMPEMGGKQCLDELLKIDPAAKVVVSSGFSPDGPTKDILEKGAKAFVGKPFNGDELLKTVRQVLDEG